MRKLLPSLLFFLTTATTAEAVPLQLTQQGRLLEPSGAAVTGLHDLTFRIYDDPTSGVLLWEEVITVDFTSGYYAAVLGADEVNNPLDSAVLSMYPIYLELELDTNGPMSPRQAINSAPYSQMAGVSENVDGGTVNASEVSINGSAVINGSGEWVGTINVNWNTQIVNMPSDIADGDDNTQLSESEVEDYVTNASIDLAAGSMMGGSTLLTIDDTITPDWSDVQNRPAGLDDGDDDTQLSSTQVVGYVEAGSVNLAGGSQVDGKNIVGQPSTCSDGQVLVYDATNNDWGCGDDTDTTLTPAEMQTAVEAMTLNLQNLPQVNGVDVLTANSALNPEKLDASGSTAEQILISDGNSVNWGEVSNQGCEFIVESSLTNKILLQCKDRPLVINGLTMKELSSGRHNYCAIGYTGKINCWGYDNYSQVSNIPTGTGYSKASIGTAHGCSIFEGSVVCWGDDTYNTISGSPQGSTFTDIAAGHWLGCAIDGLGEISCWGRDDYATVSDTPLGTGFTKISMNGYTACALDDQGSIICWGENNGNTVSNTPSGTGFKKISVGSGAVCAINILDEIICWGGSATTPPSGKFISVAAASSHACALDEGGYITCWGNDSNGEISDAPSTGGYTEIAATHTASCATFYDGLVECWGRDHLAQLNAP